MSKADTFKKPTVDKLMKSLKKVAEENEISIKTTAPKNMAKRHGSVANPFHGLGMVVPYDKRTEVGYREIPETPGEYFYVFRSKHGTNSGGVFLFTDFSCSSANLRKIFQKVEASTPASRVKAMEAVDELVTNVQFANDEGDPGMGLELGLDAFTFGGSSLHGICENLLTISYMLLGRHAFADIMRVRKVFLECFFYTNVILMQCSGSGQHRKIVPRL